MTAVNSERETLATMLVDARCSRAVCKQELQVGGSISDQAGLDLLRHAEKNKIHPHSTLGRHVAQEVEPVGW